MKKKWICIMQIVVCLIFSSSLNLFAANSYSETARLTIHMEQVKIKDVLLQIENQSEFYFLYNGKLVDVDKTVSVNVSNQTITDVLAQLFDSKAVAVRVVDRQIVLSPVSYDTGINTAAPKAQGISITGLVRDETGDPLPGVNIRVKDSQTGTTTDAKGLYSITVPDRNAVLVFTYIGFETQEQTVGNQTIINLTMSEGTRLIDEVVVVGYGTQRKGEVSSAISTIKSEDFLQASSSADVAQLIRGQVPGLTIIMPDANPTSTSQIMLRGVTTFRASRSPLILIDGIPGDLNSISPQDIQQFDVLKDGSAAAIYGTRATNGVILITTKNAAGEMPTTVDVNTYVSTQQIVKKLPFMNVDEYRELVKQGKRGARDDGASMDWLDEVMQKPLTQVYSINLKGGSRTTNYVASLEYRGINGIIKRSNNRMMYPRIEITHRMFNGKLKLNGNLSGSTQNYFSGSDGGSYNSAVYRNALTYNPTTPPKNADGKWNELTGITDYMNPLALLWEVEGENQATSLRAFGNIVLTPIEGLEIKYLASKRLYNQVRGYYETQNHYSTARSGRNGYASRGTTRNVDDMQEFTIQYSKKVAEDHTFQILGGYSWNKYNNQNYYMQNYNFPTDEYLYNSMGQGQALSDGRATEYSYQGESKLIGYVGRLTYNYKGKYMLYGSVRHEGSTKFGVNHKWGTFPAVSAAWNLKNEQFMESAPLVSNLKIRAGYGVTGTEPQNMYMSQNTLSISDYVYYGGAWMKIVRPNSNHNPDLKWEVKKETNIGLDFGLFDNRLSGDINYYYRKSTDLLWSYTVPSPPFMFTSIEANAASMMNKGLEVMVTGIIVQNKDWKWTSSANYSTNKNEVISFSNDQYVFGQYQDQGGTGEPIQQSTHRVEVGYPIGNFYGLKSVDIDASGHWIIEGADGKPKEIGEKDANDKQYLGNGLPKHYFNWNNTVAYKNFDMTITMRGAFRFQILNMSRLQYEAPVMLSRGNLFKSAYDNIYGKVPLADNQELDYLSYYIEQGDYWKIDYLTIGYNLVFKNNPWIKRARVYGSVSNLAVFTGYSGIDPEVGVSGLSPGTDDKNRYPSARTFALGVSLNF